MRLTLCLLASTAERDTARKRLEIRCLPEEWACRAVSHDAGHLDLVHREDHRREAQNSPSVLHKTGGRHRTSEPPYSDGMYPPADLRLRASSPSRGNRASRSTPSAAGPASSAPTLTRSTDIRRTHGGRAGRQATARLDEVEDRVPDRRDAGRWRGGEPLREFEVDRSWGEHDVHARLWGQARLIELAASVDWAACRQRVKSHPPPTVEKSPTLGSVFGR